MASWNHLTVETSVDEYNAAVGPMFSGAAEIKRAKDLCSHIYGENFEAALHHLLIAQERLKESVMKVEAFVARAKAAAPS